MTIPDLTTVRDAKREATQALLGDTIQLDEAAWREPSNLPGWTRGHLATHLARNADAMRGVLEGVISGTPRQMYPEPGMRDADIEAGSGRGGLELQEDLDTTAERLHQVMDDMTTDQWETAVERKKDLHLPQASALVLMRLNEVVLHHVDLNIGYMIDQIDPEVAGWLLDRNLTRMADRDDLPNLWLVDDAGNERVLGEGTHRVSGSVQNLLGWLTGRLDSSAVEGGDDITLPAI